MKLTPSEWGVRLLLGDFGLPRSECKSLKDSLIRGRESLCRITGKDLRYDVKRWHGYLLESNDGGYTLNDHAINTERRISELESNAEWLAARDEVDKIPDPRPPPTNAPQSKFALGDRVTVVQNHRNHTIRKGRIRHIEWHFKDHKWMYYLTTLKMDKDLSKRYFDDDLEYLYRVNES